MYIGIIRAWGLVAAFAAVGVGVTGGKASSVPTVPPDRTPDAGQSVEGGSRVPCAVPLRWRVTRVDRAFGLSTEEATERVREATEWWNHAFEDVLFEHDPDDGFPVRFVHDERQTELQERLRRSGDLDRERRELERRRDELAALVDTFEVARSAHESASRAHSDDVAALNRDIREWNARGGAPEDVARELETRSGALRAVRARIDDRGEELDDEWRSLEQRRRSFEREVAEHTRRGEALRRDFPPVEVQSGEYREVVRTVGNERSVGREVRVYRFADATELRLVMAHELGHALGLGHSRTEAAVMSERQLRFDGEPSPAGLHPADVARLDALCPDIRRRP